MVIPEKTLGLMAFCTLLGIAFALPGFAADRTDPAHPNVVVILADDLGWSDTGAYGNTFIDTPNIDLLARESVQLTRFYTNAVCSPTRAALQSGQYATRLTMTDFISPPLLTGANPPEFIRGHWRPFEKVDTPTTRVAFPQVPTVANAFQKAGYRTGFFGKWHLGFGPGDQPGDRGYQDSLVLEGETGANGTPSLKLLQTRIESFLEEHGARPFFLFIAPTQPHIPLQGIPELVAKYGQRSEQRQQAVPIPVYAAVVEELDTFVGDVRHSLEQRGLADSTVLLFMSDNGGLENYDLDLGGRVTSNAPLRGEKGSLYEGGIRVPFLLHWPDRIASHQSDNWLAADYDLFPTLLDIAGIEFDTPLDGRSFLPEMLGETPEDQRPIFFHYPHYHHDRPASAMITQDWKLIEFLDGGEPELYWLANDSSETKNLAAEQPERLQRMRDQLQQWHQSVGARMPVPNPNYDPTRAGEWWNPFSNERVDAELLRRIFNIKTP